MIILIIMIIIKIYF